MTTSTLTTSKELYPTFVLPGGCNLKCGFCVIGQRNEAETPFLSEMDYIRFLTDILVDFKVHKMSIQGEEPLLPQTWRLTKRLLQVATAFNCETSLVTNGTYLAEHAAEFGGFFGIADTVPVSLDRCCPERHDKLRRIKGTFEAAITGIMALQAADFYGSLQVNSVLLPHRVSYLEEMPELLMDLGIKRWALSPLIQVNAEDSTVPHGMQMRTDMEHLIAKAERLGIRVFLSDELRRHDGNDLFKGFYMETLPQGANIFRLSPDGSCSRDSEVLYSAEHSPKWVTEEEPSAFLARIFGETGVQFEPRSLVMRQILRKRALRIMKTMN